MSTKVFSTVFSFYGSMSLLCTILVLQKEVPSLHSNDGIQASPSWPQNLGFLSWDQFCGHRLLQSKQSPTIWAQAATPLDVIFGFPRLVSDFDLEIKCSKWCAIEFNNILRQQCNETFLRPSCYGCRPLRGVHLSPRSFCAPYRKSFFTWQNVYIFIVSKLQKKSIKTMAPYTKALFHFSYLQKAEAIPGRSTNFLQHILDILALVLNLRVEQVFLKIFKIPEYFFNGWQ